MNRSAPAAIDDLDRRLINATQGGFPLVDEPYRQIALGLDISEEEVLARLTSLLARGVLTRFGPLFQIERMGGRFVLAAMVVPEPQFDDVAAILNTIPEVAHNYRREHRLNMWFVLATETPEGIQEVCRRIEELTKLPVLAFPKEKEFFVDLRLPA